MRKFLVSSLLLVSIAAGCAHDAPTTVSAEDAATVARATSQGRDQVPFMATVAGRTASVRISPMLLLVEFQGRGRATHLGRVRMEGSLEVDDAFAFAGDMLVIGADGSQLIGTVSGQLVLRDFPIFDVVGTYSIADGTRRFAGAGGGGTLQGELNFDTDEVILELEGTVSSVGSLRRSD
jgi:hypothetical protein